MSVPGRSRWSDLFRDTLTPMFVLNRARRLRYVNPAWEQLTQIPGSEALGMACVRKGPTGSLYRLLAPPSECRMGRPVTVRHPVPAARQGPPWWDISFLPLSTADGIGGYLGVIQIVGPPATERPIQAPAILAGLQAQHARAYPLDLFTGTSPAARRFASQLRLALQSTEPVWIIGEPGTGKETLARVIHHQGPTREGAFVSIDCTGLQPYLIEAALFGRGGMLTAPHVGTLFLKRPMALPRDLQQRLADLDDATRPRMICAAECSPQAAVAEGSLIPDFETDLAVLEYRLPPLRERYEELPRLVARLPGMADVQIADGGWQAMRAYHWPGNLRELCDVLTSAREKAAGAPIDREHLPRMIQEKALLAADPRPRAEQNLHLDTILEAVEKRLLTLALQQSGGNQTEAAEKLGIFRARIGRRIEALGIDLTRLAARGDSAQTS